MTSVSAFSTKVPNLQLAWDASSLKSFQFCPRHYQLTNLEGWQNPSVDLAFGRYIASGQERYQKARLDGKSKEDAILIAIRAALEETWFEPESCSLGMNCDEAGVCYAEVHDEPHRCGRQATQWGGKYVDQWKCEGTKPYKNEKGNRAKCPFAFEKMWFDGDPPDVCGSCGSNIRRERRYMPDDNYKNRISLIRALIWYGLEQPENIKDGYHPYVFPDGTMAVELSGRLPLPYQTDDGETYVLTWNFDYIGSWGDEQFITDNKTTRKSLNDQYFQTYNPDTQFDTYDLIGSIAFPALNIKGTMVEGIQIMIGGVAFGKRPFYKTEEQREEHLKDLGYWIKQAESYAREGYWPMNKRNCWLCPLKTVCSLPPSNREGYLKSNFQRQERWNPVHER